VPRRFQTWCKPDCVAAGPSFNIPVHKPSGVGTATAIGGTAAVGGGAVVSGAVVATGVGAVVVGVGALSYGFYADAHTGQPPISSSELAAAINASRSALATESNSGVDIGPLERWKLYKNGYLTNDDMQKWAPQPSAGIAQSPPPPPGSTVGTGFPDDDEDSCQKNHYLHRPYIRKATRKAVETNAPRDTQGRPIDPNTHQPIDGKPDLGHVKHFEYWRMRDQAESDGLTQPQFNDLMNNPRLYQLEDPPSNRSRQYEDRSP
jgi:hypothetical protein